MIFTNQETIIKDDIGVGAEKGQIENWIETKSWIWRIGTPLIFIIQFLSLVSSSDCLLSFLGVFCCFFLDTSSGPSKSSRPGPSRQLQRWPENRGGRMKRGGNIWKHAQKWVGMELILLIRKLKRGTVVGPR